MLLDLHGWLPDLLTAHLEDLDFLWPQWVVARASPEYLFSELARLEERIEANVDALVLAGDEAEGLLEEGLGKTSTGTVLSAALVLLRGGDRATQDAVLARIATAAPASALAIGEALGLLEARAPVDPSIAALLDTGTPAVVVAGARALLLRGRAVPDPERVRAHLGESDPAVRAAAWRAAGELLARGQLAAIDRGTFEAALGDADDGVAEAAWWAAAWSRQAWLLQHAFAHATVDLRALEWLGRLGSAAERARVIAALGAEALGPRRFLAAARLGHLDVADALILASADPAPERAIPAAHAFWRITDIRKILDASVALVGPDGDPDLAETAHLPDVPALRKAWAQVRGGFAAGARWARAVDVDAAALEVLDCEARADRLVREVYRGQRAPELALLERFPLVR